MATLKTLLNFNYANGADPVGDLLIDYNGNLFGTTQIGGGTADGTAFELAYNQGTATYGTTPTNLAAFNGTNGLAPQSGMVSDLFGNLFGTTRQGGTYGFGTLFEIQKTTTGYAAPKTLVDFNNPVGSFPVGGLAIDLAGNLFGTTEYGGSVNFGTAFELAKTANGYAPTLTVLTSFVQSTGINPTGNLIEDANGNLFGTNEYGGNISQGTAFELVKTAAGYTETTLAAFSGLNGANPIAGLAMDGNGNLFGTTYRGGTLNYGTVFEIPKTASGYGAVQTLVNFDNLTGQSNGGFPISNVIIDSNGNLFGTTSYGGANNDGTVFEVQKTGSGYANAPTTIVSFAGANGGPVGGLTYDGNGNLFGTTSGGGLANQGTVFEIGSSGFVPYKPTATPDTIGVVEDGPGVTVPITALAYENNPGTVLAIGSVVDQPKYGTVTIAPGGQSLVYTPTTLDYEVGGVVTNDQDSFSVLVHDSHGGTVVTPVTVNQMPVADSPTISVQVLTPHAGDPISEVRLLVASTTGDYGTIQQGSDFIKSLQLSLGGGVAATSITDSLGLLSGNVVNASSNPGRFQDEIDVLLPSDRNINDTLTISGTAQESGPSGIGVTASASTSQSIVIDNAQSSQNLSFTTANQSIWDTGAASTYDFSHFYGVDLSTGGSTSASALGVTVASVGASIHFKTGLQADLHLTAGDISATLPFNVGLDSTYNKTTDTLQILPTEAQLGGGTFMAQGPGGTAGFGLDFGLNASAHGTLFGVGPSISTGTLGSFTKPVLGKTFKSSTLAATVSPFPGVSLSIAFPNVDTSGSNAGPGTITGKGISNDFIALSGDLVGIASDIIFGTDVTDIDFGVGSIDLLDVILTAGLNLVQQFNLNASGLTPTLLLEDNTLLPLTFGAPVTIANASTHDINHDGKIGFSLALVPSATLGNSTSIGADGKAEIQALAISLGPIDFIVYDNKAGIQFGTLPPIYQKTFALGGFSSQTVTQTV